MKRGFLNFVIMHPPAVEHIDRFLSLVREHPDLCVLENETHYFSSDSLTRGAQWYEGQFVACGEGVVQGELSTTYLETPGVAARISRDYPDAKLAAIICDPREAVAAQYVKATSTMPTRPGLEEWLEQNPDVLPRFLFGKKLLSFFGYYAPVDFLVLTLDDIRTNAGKSVIALYTLLRVSTTFIPKELRVLTEDEVKPGFWARRLRIDRWRKRRRDKRLRHAESLFAQSTSPLTVREQVLLARYYEKDVAALSDLLHRDLLTEWNFPEIEKKKGRKRDN